MIVQKYLLYSTFKDSKNQGAWLDHCLLFGSFKRVVVEKQQWDTKPDDLICISKYSNIVDIQVNDRIVDKLLISIFLIKFFFWITYPTAAAAQEAPLLSVCACAYVHTYVTQFKFTLGMQEAHLSICTYVRNLV